MTNKLIVYYSRAGFNYVNGTIKNLIKGNTQVAAELVAQKTMAPIIEIKQEIPYSNDYNECTKEAKQDQISKARPKLVGTIPDLSRYDTIYLCYPNFWGTMPMAVWTFLEQYDWTGKEIYPLCTHEGSGMGSSEQDLKKLCSGAIIKKGLPIYGSDAAHAIRAISTWLA